MGILIIKKSLFLRFSSCVTTVRSLKLEAKYFQWILHSKICTERYLEGFHFFSSSFPLTPKRNIGWKFGKKEPLRCLTQPTLERNRNRVPPILPTEVMDKKYQSSMKERVISNDRFSHNLTCETQIRTVITQSTEIQQQHKSQLTFNLFRKSSQLLVKKRNSCFCTSYTFSITNNHQVYFILWNNETMKYQVTLGLSLQ